LKKNISLFDLAKIFLVLGSSAFGGYTSLVAMIQSELVDKRKILSQQKIYDGILIASLLPGPLAVNVVTYIGYGLRGWPGAIVCGISILLPACSIMTIMAHASSVFFDVMIFKSVIAFLIPVVAAVILNVSLKMVQNGLNSYWQIILIVLTLSSLIFTSINLVTSIVIGGLFGLVFGEKKSLNIQELGSIRSVKYLLIGVIACILLMLVFFFLLSHPHDTLLMEFSKVSLTLFGGGYVMIQAINDLVVNHWSWVSSDEFNQAIALGQLTPGPILVSATYIGFKAGGLLGAFVATIGIFLPAALLMLLAGYVFRMLPDDKVISAVFSGIKPIVFAFILFSAYVVLKPIGFDFQSIGLTIIAFIMINYLKVNFLWLMLSSGILALFFI
tara:strand:- start:9548 stop:10705 length:1158 start_codon:yes stop_codon:yes gene_type:complete